MRVTVFWNLVCREILHCIKGMQVQDLRFAQRLEILWRRPSRQIDL
jgi:hypothetical protein